MKNIATGGDLSGERMCFTPNSAVQLPHFLYCGNYQPDIMVALLTRSINYKVSLCCMLSRYSIVIFVAVDTDAHPYFFGLFTSMRLANYSLPYLRALAPGEETPQDFALNSSWPDFTSAEPTGALPGPPLPLRRGASKLAAARRGATRPDQSSDVSCCV